MTRRDYAIQVVIIGVWIVFGVIFSVGCTGCALFNWQECHAEKDRLVADLEQCGQDLVDTKAGREACERDLVAIADDLADCMGRPVLTGDFPVAYFFFAPDKAELDDDGKRWLALAARVMAAEPSPHCHLTGYASRGGGADENHELSLKRAEAAQAYLVGLGVDKAWVHAVGMGETVACAYDCWLDRRVTLELVEK